MSLLSGCEPKTRYQVLSFFFDGVPEPVSRSSDGAAALSTKTADGQKEGSSIHGPFGAKMCTGCHDPNTNALLLPKDKLCSKCHERRGGTTETAWSGSFRRLPCLPRSAPFAEPIPARVRGKRILHALSRSERGVFTGSAPGRHDVMYRVPQPPRIGQRFFSQISAWSRFVPEAVGNDR